MGKERKSGLHPSLFCSIPNSLGQSLKSQGYFQLSSSLRMGWSHKEGARRPQAFHPIPTDLSRNILPQSKRNVGLTLLTLVTSSPAAVAVATSPQRPLCPALPPQIAPPSQRPADETQEGAEGCSCGEGWTERRRETFRRSDHLEAPLKRPAEPAQDCRVYASRLGRRGQGSNHMMPPS